MEQSGVEPTGSILELFKRDVKHMSNLRPEERVLDWVPNPDLKSFSFMVSSMENYADGLTKDAVRRKKNGIFLDQGREGACTGFGAQNVRALGPHRCDDASNELAFKTYAEAKRQDEWPGENYEGSSVNGAMKAMRLFGQISAWHWCLSLAEIDHALSYVGAVEAGTHWYSGMFDPGSDGYLRVTGTIAGGHAYAISGRRKMASGRVRYRIENSWGQDWGMEGAAWIWAEDLQRLLSEGGEFACPTKVI